MKNNRSFFILTSVAWMISTGFGTWFLSSSLRFFMPNGYIAFAFVGFVGVFIISLVQWRLLEECRFVLWFLATAVAIGIGSISASLAYLLAHFPIVDWQSGNLLVDWVLWPAILFFMMAIGGAPGGFLAGLLKKLAIGRGTIIRWVVVSTGSWALSFGVAGLMIQVINYPDYFKLELLQHVPFVVKGGTIGLLVGVIQGAILGSHLEGLKNIRPNVSLEQTSREA